MTQPTSLSVLVTGGGGHLGRLVVETLRNRGVRTWSTARRAVGDHPDDLRVDLTDPASSSAAVDGHPIDVIIHLAAPMHRDDAVDIGARMDTSIEAIVRATAPTALIFASTGMVYGDASAQGHTENSPVLGASPYARSKLASEEALRYLTVEMPELSVTVLRIFNIAGPDFPLSLVQRLLVADAENPATIIGPDSFVRDYIHQSDVVRVILAAIERAVPGYRVLNVGAGVPVTTRELIRSLAVADDVWVEVPGGETVSWGDNTAMQRALGVVPLAKPTRAWALPDPGRDDRGVSGMLTG